MDWKTDIRAFGPDFVGEAYVDNIILSKKATTTTATPTPTPTPISLNTAPIGKTISIRAEINGKYVSGNNTGSQLIANKTTKGNYEKFLVIDAKDGYFALKCLGNGKIVCAEKDATQPLVANRDTAGNWESFKWVNDGGDIGFTAKANSMFVSADGAGTKPLIANRIKMASYEIFMITIEN